MGGRTILCDGWKVASALKANHPELYFLLSSVPIPRSFCKHQHSVRRTLKINMKCNFWDNSEYIHRGGKRSTHYSTTDTILKVCDNADLINTSCFQHCPLTKELVQIRYNSYDRAPMDRCQNNRHHPKSFLVWLQNCSVNFTLPLLLWRKNSAILVTRFEKLFTQSKENAIHITQCFFAFSLSRTKKLELLL